MRVGILEAGDLLPPLQTVHGSFAEMFRHWLGPHLTAPEFVTYRVYRDVFPDRVDECDAWLITGSRAGVYDTEAWIAPLAGWVRRIAAARRPLLGICFGHQIIAEALGGKAVISDKGWGTGIQTYRVETDHGTEELPVIVSHQDQVIELPPGARLIGGSDHCPLGALVYEAPILTVQFHPEITAGLSADIIRLRAGTSFPEEQAQRALNSLATPAAATRAGAWMGGWLMAQVADAPSA